MKLAEKFYDEIEANIEGYLDEYEPDDRDLDSHRYLSRGVIYSEGNCDAEPEFELLNGYYVDVALDIDVSMNKYDDDYDSPGYGECKYYWRVKKLTFYDENYKIIEVFKAPYDFMSGVYEC